jgi:hypothetical protein
VYYELNFLCETASITSKEFEKRSIHCTQALHDYQASITHLLVLLGVDNGLPGGVVSGTLIPSAQVGSAVNLSGKVASKLVEQLKIGQRRQVWRKDEPWMSQYTPMAKI